MRIHSNYPRGVVKAVLGISDGSMSICQYPFFRSILEKKKARPRLGENSMSSILEMGNYQGMVQLLISS